MRARWVFLVAGGVLAVCLGLLFIRPRAERPAVTLLHQTNLLDVTIYMIQVSNTTDRAYLCTAWLEYQTNGLWRQTAPYQHGITLQPAAKDVFILPKSGHNTARITVFYNRLAGGDWDYWRDALRALIGLYPVGEKMYLDTP